jgi:hypothetical protein
MRNERRSLFPWNLQVALHEALLSERTADELAELGSHGGLLLSDPRDDEMVRENGALLKQLEAAGGSAP